MLIPLKPLLEKYNLNINGVIHLGASSGQERDAYRELGCAVIWVEAIPEVFNELVGNLQLYKNQIAVSACIGAIDGEEKIFNVSNNEGQSSSYLNLGTHKISHPEVHYIGSFATKTTRVDTLAKDLKLEIDESWLLMADLQGAEMDALIGCGELLNKFGAVYLEVNELPLYEGCALKNEVEEFLNGYGFNPVEEFIYKQWGWGDEFFVKNISEKLYPLKD